MSQTSDPAYGPGEIDPLRERLYRCWDSYLDRLILEAEEARPTRWNRDFSSIEAYLRSIEPNRGRFLQMVGGWPPDRCELNPRRQQVARTSRYDLDRVFLTVLPGVEIDCLLLIPPGGGRRPAVLAQHGLNGTPEEACGFVEERHQFPYNRLGIRLVEEGYVVLAPHMVGGFGTEEWGEQYVGGEPQTEWNRARVQMFRKSSLVGPAPWITSSPWTWWTRNASACMAFHRAARALCGCPPSTSVSRSASAPLSSMTAR